MQVQHQASEPDIIQDIGEADQGAGHGVVQEQLPEVRMPNLQQQQHSDLAQVETDGRQVESPHLGRHRLERIAVRPTKPRRTDAPKDPWGPRNVPQ
eukprot:CAMPEP_0176180722 /NCGR_PEP_ID=MMETSP0120_2-20121206/92602_1 /TAXON_ID=160619 /ORGANISM="Kryptoperidinium foliaceum, Strain CCMP 1326" /LENGTH=95 /DNA_ID=CAMNT_0017518937 /DNA_START=450 /DNA_END=737 /DNA_ORIENTATION=+